MSRDERGQDGWLGPHSFTAGATLQVLIVTMVCVWEGGGGDNFSDTLVNEDVNFSNMAVKMIIIAAIAKMLVLH